MQRMEQKEKERRERADEKVKGAKMEEGRVGKDEGERNS